MDFLKQKLLLKTLKSNFYLLYFRISLTKKLNNNSLLSNISYENTNFTTLINTKQTIPNVNTTNINNIDNTILKSEEISSKHNKDNCIIF